MDITKSAKRSEKSRWTREKSALLVEKKKKGEEEEEKMGEEARGTWTKDGETHFSMHGCNLNAVRTRM